MRSAVVCAFGEPRPGDHATGQLIARIRRAIATRSARLSAVRHILHPLEGECGRAVARCWVARWRWRRVAGGGGGRC